ncbi:MAG: hypothetical protein M0Z67_16365 [Nitrospiraceae bacterium]|nr:hypothetical protein [Nitrospiraceae bacterium]
MTYSLDLDVLKSGEGDIPAPCVRVYVKAYGSDERGLIYITPECVSIQEVESEIDRLKKELEEIGIRAKREFTKI